MEIQKKIINKHEKMWEKWMIINHLIMTIYSEKHSQFHNPLLIILEMKNYGITINMDVIQHVVNTPV